MKAWSFRKVQIYHISIKSNNYHYEIENASPFLQLGLDNKFGYESIEERVGQAELEANHASFSGCLRWGIEGFFGSGKG